MKHFKRRTTALALSLAATGAVQAENPLDGILDTTFSGDGLTRIFFDQDANLPLDMAFDAVADSVGRTYVVGTVQTPNGQRIGIVRLNTAGNIDVSYGPNGNGRVIAPDQAGFNLTGVSAALDNQGFLLVAGTLNQNNNNDFAVCRFNTSGTPVAFAGSNFLCRSVGFDLGGQTANADVLRDVLVQPDGKIVLVGHATASLNPFIIEGAIARLNPNASFDNTFGVGGKRSFLPDGTSQVQFKAAAIQDNGKIVVACNNKISGFNDSDPCVARFTSGGTLDNTFSTDGFVSFIAFDGARDTEINAIALVPRQNPQLLLDQTIIIAGKRETNIGTGIYDGLVGRILPNALPDSTFSGDGFRTDINSSVFNDIEFQYDGSVTVAGTRLTAPQVARFYVTRFDWTGLRDTAAFNAPDGFISIKLFPGIDPTQDYDEGNAMAFHPNRIIVAGSSKRTNPGDFDYGVAALVRDRIFHDGVEGLN